MHHIFKRYLPIVVYPDDVTKIEHNAFHSWTDKIIWPCLIWVKKFWYVFYGFRGVHLFSLLFRERLQNFFCSCSRITSLYQPIIPFKWGIRKLEHEWQLNAPRSVRPLKLKLRGMLMSDFCFVQNLCTLSILLSNNRVLFW